MNFLLYKRLSNDALISTQLTDLFYLNKLKTFKYRDVESLFQNVTVRRKQFELQEEFYDGLSCFCFKQYLT